MKRFFAIPKERRRLLLEACRSLVIARLMLLFLPFPWLASYASRRTSKAELEGVERNRICRQVAEAVDRVADLSPMKIVCFPRGIAAQAMLRRRGISTTLYYGAVNEGRLVAHVWIQDGENGVIGMPPPSKYTVVAIYPSLR